MEKGFGGPTEGKVMSSYRTLTCIWVSVGRGMREDDIGSCEGEGEKMLVRVAAWLYARLLTSRTTSGAARTVNDEDEGALAGASLRALWMPNASPGAAASAPSLDPELDADLLRLGAAAVADEDEATGAWGCCSPSESEPYPAKLFIAAVCAARSS